MVPSLLKNRAAGRPLRVAARPAYCNERINPYNSLLYRAVSAAGGVTVREHKYAMFPWECEIVHFHWPEYDVLPRSSRPLALFKTTAVWAWLLLARLSGVKIVWTAHNAFPHDKKRSGLNTFLWKRFLSTLDGVVFPSEESASIVTAEYPALAQLPSAFVKIGHYGPWIDSVRAVAAAPSPEVILALEQLKGAFVVLNFGLIRPYKNIDELMRLFSTLEDPKLRLLVTGRVYDAGYMVELEALASADQRIVFLPKHLDDASLVACLDRADLVVLPFRKVLNSASALTAMSFGKHVVVPAIGSMRSLQRDVGSDALTLYEGPVDADILRAAIERVRAKRVAPPNLAEYEWPYLGAKLAEYYRCLIGRT